MKTVLPETCDILNTKDSAALCLQRHYRGRLGRRKYLEALLKRIQQEDEVRFQRTLQQVEEGELLIENHRLEVEFEDNHCIRRNRYQRRLSQVITIQRAWRRFKRSSSKQKFSSLPHETGLSDGGVQQRNAGDINGNNLLSACSHGNTIKSRPNLVQNQASFATNIGSMNTDMNSRSPVYAVSDLGSDLEIDNRHLSDTSPDTPSKGRINTKNINKLSLAEEFASIEEKIMGDFVVGESEGESDYYCGSSAVTTPDWDSDKVEHHDRPEIYLRRGKSSPNGSPDGVGPDSHHHKKLLIEDPNRNRDLNANMNRNDESSEVEDSSASSHVQYRKSMCRTDSLCSLDKRKIEEIQPELRTGKVSCGASKLSISAAGDSDTSCCDNNAGSENVQSMDEDESTRSSCSAPVSFPRVEVSHVTDKCPNCEGEQGGGTCGAKQMGENTDEEELSMPVLDWASLERHLEKLEIEEQKKKQLLEQSPRQVQKNSRMEILRKLAMGEEDIDCDMYGKGRDKFSTRLQSGMNLQICFVNNSVDGSDAEEGTAAGEADGARPKVGNRDSRFLFSRESSVGSSGSGTSPKTPSVTFEDLEDFESKQARLQAEARIALAQAEPLARLQMQLEKQQRKKSPTTELAGVSGLSDISDGLSTGHFSKKLLQTMSISKLQYIVNELHSQIERLNEELVHFLMARDELQMEQDSQLVDIEDLTRWIRMNMHHNNNNGTLLSHEPLPSNPRRKHAEQTLLKLLGKSLPASGRKCICGVSRSSSVVSNRSASSPEPENTQRNPLSPTSPQSCRSESSISESHTSSPELTWVRQAIVRYWYN